MGHLLRSAFKNPLPSKMISLQVLISEINLWFLPEPTSAILKKTEKFNHHILNPFTGYPYETHLQQVTIISDASVDGDALSTTCFALGLEEGSKLIKSLDEIEAIFVTDDGNIHRVG